ncbi:MAG: LON peptidase substrate-binding domain-containing protein [Acidobacteriaceae bacterium]|nr:LON peptidase substrate-binding domain-containing protein [Acidobacteriaceae bacterium]
MSALLPLFPLDLVLLPGTPLPLHVFEPRYKEMISECLEKNEVFGIIRAKDDGMAEIGCTAEIVTVTKKYDDGRMDIVTQGRDRFEVMQVNQDRSFLRGEVVYLRDEPGAPSTDEIQTALRLHSDIMSLAGAAPVPESDVDKSQLSFYLAGSLPLDLDFKQALLGMKSEPERLRAIISFFETILPSMRRAVHVRRKAGGNGHAS